MFHKSACVNLDHCRAIHIWNARQRESREAEAKASKAVRRADVIECTLNEHCSMRESSSTEDNRRPRRPTGSRDLMARKMALRALQGAHGRRVLTHSNLIISLLGLTGCITMAAGRNRSSHI